MSRGGGDGFASSRAFFLSSLGGEQGASAARVLYNFPLTFFSFFQTRNAPTILNPLFFPHPLFSTLATAPSLSLFLFIPHREKTLNATPRSHLYRNRKPHGIFLTKRPFLSFVSFEIIFFVEKKNCFPHSCVSNYSNKQKATSDWATARFLAAINDRLERKKAQGKHTQQNINEKNLSLFLFFTNSPTHSLLGAGHSYPAFLTYPCLAASSSASLGPLEPAGYLCTGSSPASVAASSGSKSAQAARSSSRRTKCCWSPLTASSRSRS